MKAVSESAKNVRSSGSKEAVILSAADQISLPTAARKVGGSLMVSIPAAYVTTRRYVHGTQFLVKERPEGLLLVEAAPVKPKKPTLKQLLANTPEFNRVDGWEEAEPAGREWL